MKKIEPAAEEKSTSDKSLEQKIIDGVDTNKITELPTSNKTTLKALFQNEDGDSYLLIKLFRHKYLYDHAAGVWYYWNDHYWRFDELNHAPVLIKDVIRMYNKQLHYENYALDIAKKKNKEEDEKTHKYIAKKIKERVEKLQTIKRKKNILSLAVCGTKSLGYPGSNWDTKPMLLGCKNGCLDLKNGSFGDGQPADYLKTVSPIEWGNIDTPCPIWEKFLLDIFGQDQSIVDYMQRLLGYGITGLTTEHIYPILWGAKGRNGKGTLLETLKYILGPLAYKAPATFFMQQGHAKQSGSADAEMMAFRGARLVWGSETNEGDRLDTAKLKELVGGDTISARPPYGKRQIEFKPSHLLLLITNKRPRVPANDLALWRRIHLIPFLYSFIDDPDTKDPFQVSADKELLDKLKIEAPGILAWLVKGCILWQEFGLLPPDSISIATEKYREEEDILGHFLIECCYQGNNQYKAKGKDLYSKYKEWCLEVGHNSMAKKRFLKDMRERFGDPVPTEGVRTFRGVGILSNF